MTILESVDEYLETHLTDSLAELSRLCAQPSIAAQRVGLEACAELVAGMLHARGFTVQIHATGGAPVVYAEREGRSDRTLLFYNHYDVQPAEPLDLWDTPPFEPTHINGKIFARGVSDNKGHFASRLHALDGLLAAQGELPCRVKFVLEGEEEISSPHLPQFVEENAGLLSADVCIWESGGVDHREIPLQVLGLRGICYVELSVQTARVDSHSGLGGGIFPNAAWRLIWALNSLKGPDERVRIPGFYERVRPPDERDRRLVAELPEMAGVYQEQYGITHYIKGLEGGAELRLAAIFEPTCTVCGLEAGYQGPGSKTVLPARASAKVDFRLVPDQQPEEVFSALRAHLDRQGFGDVQATFVGGTPPARTDPEAPFVKLVMDAAEPVYGHRGQIVPFSGGSGPNHPFIHNLGLPIAMAGLSYPGTRAHAPNENIRVDLYLKTARHVARLLHAYGNDRPRG